MRNIFKAIKGFFTKSKDISLKVQSSAVPAATTLSDPYVLMIVNTSEQAHEVPLFGFNWNFDKPNLGLPEGISVTNIQVSEPDGGYAAVLAQFQENPIVVGKWRFQSSTAVNLLKTIYFWNRDANGEEHKYPLNLSVMLDAYQTQSTILDVTKMCPIDGNMTVLVPVAAKSNIVISIYPREKYVVRKRQWPTLEDRIFSAGVEEMSLPQLSGKNMPPIIIQTSDRSSSGIKRYFLKVQSFFIKKK